MSIQHPHAMNDASPSLELTRKGRRPSNDLRVLWLLRMLVPLKGFTWLLQHEDMYACDRAAAMLGLPSTVTKAEIPARKAALRQAWLDAEARAGDFRLRQPLARNLEKISRLFGFDRVESQVLGFVLTAAFDPAIEAAINEIPALSNRIGEPWTRVLGLSKAAVRKALSANSRLGRAGLFQMESPIMQAVSGLQMNRPELGGVYVDGDWRPERLLKGLARKAPAPELTLADYAHLQADIDLMLRYLGKAMAHRRKGVNILLYGLPGSGKTQLARVLGQALDAVVHEVETTDAEGESSSGTRRLGMLSTLHRVLAGRRALVVFDEIDQVFADGNWFTGVRTTADRMRGWLLDQLECNAVPTLWIGNDMGSLDPAFARRFDIVLEMNAPPRAQRTEMIRRHAGRWLEEGQVRKLAQVQNLSPATLRRAARVVSGAGLRATQGAQAMEGLIRQSLRVQSRNPGRDPLPPLVVPDYDPSLSHTSANLEAIADGLARTGEGRLCLYGPPGTGKSAFGHWLGERLGRPVLLRRASDLLGAFVGQTEENIAKAFRTAQQDGAVLQIDEVDGFLGDRQQARARWEASLVNEMLTQMEGFRGIFVASTNLMHGLDPAALRRFDAKVLFGYLQPDQSWRLFVRLCGQCGMAAPAESSPSRARLAAAATLTAGDFSAVARRHLFEPFLNPLALIEALEAECRLKPDVTTRRVGFV